MSHVDEGALHAYLDGALDEYPVAEAERIRTHLDRCAECAERLEVERRIRADAHAMLGMAAPDVELPTFEELRAYVDRTHEERSAMARLHRLGWAASVVLAIGAGWMLRDGQLQTRALDMGQDRIAAPASEPAVGEAEAPAPILERQGRMADETVERESLETRGDEESGVAQGSLGVERAIPVEELTGRADLPATVVAGSTDSVDVSAPPRDAAAPTAETESLEERRRAAPEPDAVDADIAARIPPLVSTSAADELAAERAAAPETAMAQVDPTMEAPPPAPSDVANMMSGVVLLPDSTADSAGAGAAADPDEPAESRRRAESPVPVTSALRATAQPTTFEVAKADDEVPAEPLSSVPGFEVVEVRSLGDGSTLWGIRTLQRLAPDVTFEVIRLEPGIDPSVLSAAEAGLGEARAETGSGWLLVRGPLSEEALEELLLRLLPR